MWAHDKGSKSTCNGDCATYWPPFVTSGKPKYRVALPESVAADKVEAKLSDGVLAIRVPKVEKATRKHIQIKS